MDSTGFFVNQTAAILNNSDAVPLSQSGSVIWHVHEPISDEAKEQRQCDADRLGGDFDLVLAWVTLRRGLSIFLAHSAVHIGNDFVRFIGFDFVSVL